MSLYIDVYFVVKLYFVFRYITVSRSINGNKVVNLTGTLAQYINERQLIYLVNFLLEVQMTKLAILTDIHGNNPALEAVLHDISTRDVDHIYCLGDVVGIGPDSNEVLEMILSRTDISFVVGNHDVAVMAAFYGEDVPKGHQNERHHHQWLADRINPVYIEEMRKWSKQLIINYFDK